MPLFSNSDYQLAASCIMPRLNPSQYCTDERYKTKILNLASQGVAGFCVFDGTIDEVKISISEIKSHTKKQLLFSADYEYGLPMRLHGGTAFPHAFALGKINDMNKTALVSSLIAKEALQIGINWDFAPVCDINSNRRNPIINIRSYGEEPEVVSQMAAAYIIGMQNQGVAACAKHFPGHGDTNTDSHLALPVLNHTIERLREFEYLPFIKAIKSDVKSIMIGHLAVPNLIGDDTPASLSEVTYSTLRNELKYNGLILTDALDMLAIAKYYDSGLASYKSILAGANIALMPSDPEFAIEYLAERINAGDDKLINQIETSKSKIKELLDWIDSKSGNVEFLNQNTQEHHEKIALTLAIEAIESNQESNNIELKEENQIAAFAFLQNEKDFKQASMFFNLLSQATEINIDYAYIDEKLSEEDLQEFKVGIQDADSLLFAFFYKSKAFEGSIGDYTKINSIINRLAEGREIYSVFFGNPYIDDFITSDNKLFTYSDSLASIAAAVMKLTGRKLE